MRRSPLLVLAGLLAGLTVSPLIAESAGKWPAPEPIEYTYQFEDASKAELRMSIKRHTLYKIGRYSHYGPGKDLYWIECHQPDFSDDEFSWSGAFECRLISRFVVDRYPNLLTDNPDMMADWDSRGRFLTEELLGNCANYPEYGRVRHFRLRGMRITLEMSNIKWLVEPADAAVSPELESFDFSISVEPDKKATSRIAELPEYEDPLRRHPGDDLHYYRECSNVIRRGKQGSERSQGDLRIK